MALDKVHVPQEDGDIVATTPSVEPSVRTWRVSDHLVTPASAEERDWLLGTIAGAKPAPTDTRGGDASTSKEK